MHRTEKKKLSNSSTWRKKQIRSTYTNYKTFTSVLFTVIKPSKEGIGDKQITQMVISITRYLKLLL